MAKKPDPEGYKRAAELHEQIEQLKRGDQTPPPTAETERKRPMTPREFIQKRMAELDKKK
jgi:hypothetical protein